MSSRFLQSPDPAQANRRNGRTAQLSTPDVVDHATERVGDMYGDDDLARGASRPLSFAPSQQERQLERKASRFSSSSNSSASDSQLSKSLSNGRASANTAASPTDPVGRARQLSTGSTPDLSRASSTDTANQAFPLNDIDYESSPAAVAQELSNLQAIRRMSMNVDAADPDLPSFSSGLSLPSLAPSPTSDENDTARLFWVPARLHPELAPKDYRTFVEDRVDRIKRRSGDEEPGSPDSLGRSGSGDSKVDRRKSMLSKTVEMSSDLKDGADVLERRRSNHRRGPSAETSLQELEALVSDPAGLARKMSLDTSRQSIDSDPDAPLNEDMPMLPAPLGSKLKRSTRTQYNRRGSLRKDGRIGRRGTVRTGERDEAEQTASVPPMPGLPRASTAPQDESVLRVQSAPVPPATADSAEGFAQRQSRPQGYAQDSTAQDYPSRPGEAGPSAESESGHARPRQFHSKIASHGRTTAQLPGMSDPTQVPQIVETPPEGRHSIAHFTPTQSYPERKSSQGFSRTNSLPSSRRSGGGEGVGQQGQSLEQMASKPAPVPGTNTNTAALSFIPTVAEEKKADKAEKKSKKESGESSSRKGGWGWLLGGEDKRKEDKEEREQSKKSRSKNKSADKSYDSTRLDVLQQASDGPRARESLVLERDNSDVKLEEERKKSSSGRKGGGSEKKEKEPGILSSLFGGAKKKADKESSSKKQQIHRGLSPEPPRRAMLPDIDYNWTRFSILEERAIYRMAHIKLANPRRPLQSQVLLSNFMYSYLAKVQQMHPQIQIPHHAQSKAQKQKQQEQEKESDEYSQWQRYQEQQDRMTGHSEANGSDPYGHASTTSSFIDDYDTPNQQGDDQRDGHYGMYDQHGTTQEQEQRQQQWHERDPYTQQGLFDDDRPPEEDDMW